MIELTEEMLVAWRDAMAAKAAELVSAGAPLGSSKEVARAGLAAVLAIVERDLGMVGPCSSALPHLVDPEIAEFCELRHGHSGDHESGPTRWRELP